MKTQTANEELNVLLAAGYRLIGLETRDDAAAYAAIDSAMAMRGIQVKKYDPSTDIPKDHLLVATVCAERLFSFLEDNAEDNGEPVTVVLRDIGDAVGDPKVVALIKNYLMQMGGKCAISYIFVIGRNVVFSPELEELSCVMTVALPSSEEIGDLVDDFAAKNGLTIGSVERREVTSALRGVPGITINRLLGMSFAKTGKLSAQDVANEKTRSLRKNGLIEPIPLTEAQCAVGGMVNLRGYLSHVSNIFANIDEAKAFGVDFPRGVLIAGMPGCGKSLAVKFAANMFGVPLLRLDTGRLMGKYNGESERNLREALAAAESMAPCVLWIDEIEKAFAGVGKDADNGVATRLFGSFLTWMNERSANVYTIATANDILGLPPELMRRGRFDELFFVDFPTVEECEEILHAQIGRRGHFLADGDVRLLAEGASQRGFSGADLEGLVKTAIELAFERRLGVHKDEHVDPETAKVAYSDFAEAMAWTKSTSESMSAKINDLRGRLNEFRLTPASTIASTIH